MSDRKKRHRQRYIRVLMLALLTAMAFQSSQASENATTPVPDTLTWTVPFGVGGGTDVWARFMSHWVGESLENHPAIVINNVPGGGSITGANLFYGRARSNGAEMIVTSASTQYPAMLKDPRVRFDYSRWTPIIAAPTGGVVYAQSTMGGDPEEILEHLRQHETKFGAQTPTGLELPILLAFDMLGLQVDPVFGMRSRGEGRLAFERGEAGIDFQTTSAYFSSVTPLVKSGQAVPLFSLGVMNDDNIIVRDPAFPDLPTFSELYLAQPDTSRDDMAYQVYHKFFASGYALQKLLLVPRDIDASLLATYRDAARKLAKNPEFLEAARQRIGPYDPVTGDVAARQLEAAMQMNQTRRQWIVDWLKQKHDIRVVTQ